MILSISLVLASTIAIFATNVVILVVLCGIGLLPRRAFGLNQPEERDWFISFWIGLAGTIWFLILWNFAFPVNSMAFATVFVAGTLGLFLERRSLVRIVSDWIKHPSLVAILLVSSLWLANVATGPMVAWDSGLYHIPAINWAGTYPVVPGLANLYGPLGFNNSSLLYGALLQAGPWGSFAHHVASSSLIGAMLAQCLVAGFRVASSKRIKWHHLFEFFLLVPVVTMISPSLAVSFVTDVPANLTLLAGVSVIYAYLSERDADPRRKGYQLVEIATLLALAVSFKFSTGVFALVAYMVVVATWIRTSQRQSVHVWKPVVWATVIAAGMGLSWMVRGVVLSGYPAFPNAVGAVAVEWRVPLEHAKAEFDFIVHSGRASASALGVTADVEQFSVWFPMWLPRLLFEPPIQFELLLPLVLAIVALIVYIPAKRRIGNPTELGLNWLLLVPVVFALCAWFMVAPEPRYVTYAFWASAALCCTQVVRLLLSRTADPHFAWRRLAIGVGVVLGISPALINPILTDSRRNTETPSIAGLPAPLSAVVRSNLSRTPIGQGTTALDVPELETVTTDSGLSLHVPVGGWRCIDAPLPCTPNPAPNLRLRVPGSLSQGFMVEGDWQMQTWPNSRFPHFLEASQALRTRRLDKDGESISP